MTNAFTAPDLLRTNDGDAEDFTNHLHLPWNNTEDTSNQIDTNEEPVNYFLSNIPQYKIENLEEEGLEI